MFSFSYSQVRISVCPEKDRFVVSVAVTPGMDEMWVSLTHAARFSSRAAAEKLAARIKAAWKIDLAHWTWIPFDTTPYACLQKAPTAKPYLVG